MNQLGWLLWSGIRLRCSQLYYTYNIEMASKQQTNETLTEWVQQIRQALQNDETSTISILLEDESSSAIQYLLEQITQKDLQAKLRSIISQLDSTTNHKLTQQKQEEEIRKINQHFDSMHSSSSEDFLFNDDSKKVKKKKRDDRQVFKLDNKSGFEFYGNVKCLMVAYGDLSPMESAVKMMHSQLELLFRQLMSVVRGNKQGQSANSIPITSSFELKEFLRPIFTEDEKDFTEISRIYRKIKTHTKIRKPNLVPDNSSESSRKLSDDDFPSSDRENTQLDDEARHMHTKDVQEMGYLVEITNNMLQSEYRQYCQCRSVNFFMHKKSPEMQKKLRQFIDTESVLNKQVFLVHVLQFLSFVGCRFIKRVIYSIIRERNHQECGQRKLKRIKKPLEPQEITAIGNMLLDQYASSIQSTVKEAYELSVQAKQIFIDEFSNQKLIQEIFPRSVLNRYRGCPQKMWKQCQHYRKMWEQRLKGEKEIMHVFRYAEKGSRKSVEGIVDKIAFGDIILENEYSRVIVQNYEQYFLSEGPEEQQKIQRMNVFRKYVTSENNQVFEEERSRRKQFASKGNSHEGESEEIPGKKPRKRKQLESLRH